ncbi:adaptin-binding domain-containing protein [Aspergillus homomorphus CBS 101889]|uniref:Alpha and gamma adaptin binding protein p34 n=1 Tax=Aspergillus homomorphus (strain CBS 101889) TaxID=1450537 RepID=A0A395IAI6_ASPHC|nr:hypothetical protein BO97DRAFT_384087 [Aspergillus homomorphus CBS 101889]RAL16088.1 hypothetical protein BO97DRAFT_384087 [Aspergillus homomorphus CBS 101889]
MDLDKPSTNNSRIIRNPRRLLILSPSSHSTTIIPPLLHTLTGAAVTEPPSTSVSTPTATPAYTHETALSSTTTLVASSASSIATATATASPPPATPTSPNTTTTTSFAGYTTHPPLPIQNRYYTAEIPIWVDEIPLSAPSQPQPAPAPAPSTTTSTSTPTPTQWQSEFSSPEAQVVRDAIGAVLICARNPTEHHPPPTADMASPMPPSTATHTPEESVFRAAEDHPDVVSLKEFIRAIGEVRGLIEEERGGMGVAEVPGVLVLVDSAPSSSSSSSSGGAATKGTGRAGGLDLDDDGPLDGGEIDEPFSVGWWEDQLCEMGLMGWEVVRWCPRDSQDDQGRNRYGELQGMRRVKEVLETHDWSAAEEDAEDKGSMDMGLGDEDDLERRLLGLDDAEDGGFDFEVNELEREMVGLRMAIERGSDDYFVEEAEADEELRVDAVEALLLRMRAIKDMSDGLPETERKRFAAKAVRDIMREL